MTCHRLFIFIFFRNVDHLCYRIATSSGHHDLFFFFFFAFYVLCIVKLWVVMWSYVVTCHRWMDVSVIHHLNRNAHRTAQNSIEFHTHILLVWFFSACFWFYHNQSSFSFVFISYLVAQRLCHSRQIRLYLFVRREPWTAICFRRPYCWISVYLLRLLWFARFK